MITNQTDAKFSILPYSLLPTPYSLLPDFWSRQTHTPTDSFEFAPFSTPTRITTNHPEILAAARLSSGRFSLLSNPQSLISNLHAGRPISLQLTVTTQPTPPLPADLPERLVYAGVGDWISVSAGEWGHAFAHLPSRTAVAFLSPALAAETRLVSRYIIDHYLLNFILTDWAMLHASCVLDPSGQRLILMVAPHNTGKSTTALHLLRAGYIFLADGMALLRRNGPGFVVGGYPIGEVKLRDDVLALFPTYTGEAVRVREQRKTVVNLRAVHKDRLAETLFTPQQIQLCLVERSGNRQTEIAPLSPAEAEPVLAANSVFWDEPSRLAHNTAALQTLLKSAALHRLRIGTEPDGIVETIAKLS